MIARLDFTNEAARAAWLADVAAQVADLEAAALDATAPEMDRELGPKAARRQIAEAAGKLRAALSYAGHVAEEGDAARPTTDPK